MLAVLAASLAAPPIIRAQETDDEAKGAEQSGQPQPPVEPAVTSAQDSASPVAPEAATVATATAPRASASASRAISIGDYFFAPGRLEVDVGDKVTWTNNGKVDEGHTVTGDGLDSGVLKQGDTYSHTFGQAGNFSYICTLHPNMEGTVAVAGRSASGNKTTDSDSKSGSGDPTDGGSSEAKADKAATAVGGSESAGSSDGGGGSRSLPATGSDSLLLALYGIVLLELGLALRMVSLSGLPRRRWRLGDRLRGGRGDADQLAHEGRQVGGAPRGDQVAIYHYLCVLPLGARVSHVVGDAGIGRDPAALDDPG